MNRFVCNMFPGVRVAIPDQTIEKIERNLNPGETIQEVDGLFKSFRFWDIPNADFKSLKYLKYNKKNGKFTIQELWAQDLVSRHPEYAPYVEHDRKLCQYLEENKWYCAKIWKDGSFVRELYF